MADMEPERRFNEFEHFDQFVNAETVAGSDPQVPSALTPHDLSRLERFETALRDIKQAVGQTKSTGELTRLTQQRQEGAMQQIFAALQMLTGKVDALGNELARDRAERALEKDGHAPSNPGSL